MARILNGNVWVYGVYFSAGTSESDIGSAAGDIGDHLWRTVGDDGSQPAAAPVPEQSFVTEEQGPSAFTPAEPAPELKPAPEPEPVPEPEPSEVDVPPAAEFVSDGAPAVEPAESVVVPDAPKPPPHAGKGSSEQAWRDYAAAVGVGIEGIEDRRGIRAALEAAGKPV